MLGVSDGQPQLAQPSPTRKPTVLRRPHPGSPRRKLTLRARRRLTGLHPPPPPRPVQEVVALPVALDPACDRDLVIVDGQAPCRVVEDHGHLGERGSRAALTPGEDDLFHLAAADVLRLAGAEHPLDSIDDVGLAGAVRPDDPGDTALEADLG